MCKDDYIIPIAMILNVQPFRSRRHRASLKKYDLFALKFSEYMGNVHSALLFDNNKGNKTYDFNQQKTYKSKVHGVASATRRFSSKPGTNTSSSKKKNKHDRAKSLSFRDKYSQSAIDEFKKIYATKSKESDDDQKDESKDNDNENDKNEDNNNENLQNRQKLSTIEDSVADNIASGIADDLWDDEDDVYYDDTSSSDDDEKQGAIRMTSVADRGQQTYYDPNNVNTYKTSTLFSFTPSKHEDKLLDQSPNNDDVFKSKNLESMKSLPQLPALAQGNDDDEKSVSHRLSAYDPVKQNLVRKSIPRDTRNGNENRNRGSINNGKRRPSTKKEKALPPKPTVDKDKIKREIAESPMVRNIVSKPKYHVRNTTQDVGKFLDHIDQTMGVDNFARYVAMSDGNVNQVEQVYSKYRKRSMSGDALKQVEMEEKKMMEMEEQKQKEHTTEMQLSLKRKSRPNTPLNKDSKSGGSRRTKSQKDVFNFQPQSIEDANGPLTGLFCVFLVHDQYDIYFVYVT